MDRLLVVGCKKTIDVVCVGCSRCLVSFNRREGHFRRYADSEAELIGVLSCGDCPGSTLIPRLALMKLWNAPLDAMPTRIHVAPCLVNLCPHAESIIDRMEVRCGIEIIVGTHPYQMETIFGLQPPGGK
jgi:predicted metal-binding protein